MLETGIHGRAEAVVCEQNTARAMGSGDLPVFATPCMVALMEDAEVKALFDKEYIAMETEKGTLVIR